MGSTGCKPTCHTCVLVQTIRVRSRYLPQLVVCSERNRLFGRTANVVHACTEQQFRTARSYCEIITNDFATGIIEYIVTATNWPAPLGVEPKSHIFYPQHINALMRRRYADYMRNCIFTARLTHWLIAAKPLGSRLNGFGNHSWRQLTHQATHCLIVTQTIAYCSDSRYHRSRPVIRENASLNCRKPSAPCRLNLSGSRSASPYPGGYSFGFDSWQSRCR